MEARQKKDGTSSVPGERERRRRSDPGRQFRFKNNTEHQTEHQKERQLTGTKVSKILRGPKTRHIFENLDVVGFYRRMVVKWRKSKRPRARHNSGSREEVGFYRKAVIKWEKRKNKGNAKPTLDVRRVLASKLTTTTSKEMTSKQLTMDAAFKRTREEAETAVLSPPRIENTAAEEETPKASGGRGKNGSPIKKLQKKEEEVEVVEMTENPEATGTVDSDDSEDDVQLTAIIKRGKARSRKPLYESSSDDSGDETPIPKRLLTNIRDRVKTFSLVTKVDKTPKSKANNEIWFKCHALFRTIQEKTPHFIIYKFTQKHNDES